MPRVEVPIATYTGWNLRNPSIGAPDALLGLGGGYIPFPITKAAREASGDPRLSVEERYQAFDVYHQQTMDVATTLVKDGYLLNEHLSEIEADTASHRGLFEE